MHVRTQAVLGGSTAYKYVSFNHSSRFGFVGFMIGRHRKAAFRYGYDSQVSESRLRFGNTTI